MQLENDINLAALGEQWRGVARGVDDFLFLSIGTGMGAGLVLRGELHRGRNGAAGELDYAFVGVGPDADPCAAAVSLFAQELAAAHIGVTSLLPPFEPRPIFAAARAGDPLAREIVAEEARRIALHVLPGRRRRRRRARRARRRHRRERRPAARADQSAPRATRSRTRRASRCRHSARPPC